MIADILTPFFPHMIHLFMELHKKVKVFKYFTLKTTNNNNSYNEVDVHFL